MKKVHIKTAFSGKVGRRPEDFVSIAVEAARAAIDDGGTDRVRRIYLASYASHVLCNIDDPALAIMEGIRSVYPSLRAESLGIFKTGGEALYAALNDMSSGAIDGDVVLIGAEKMTHLEPAVAAGRLSGLENDHDAKYGATLPALGGLVTRAWLDRYDVPEDAMHRVSVKNHRHGALNSKAHFQREVSLEEVAASPLVADPLRRLHCAPLSDGAAGVRLSLDGGSIAFIGWGAGTDTYLFQERADVTRFAATSRAASDARTMAGVGCDDIDIVEIHDAFASFELINLEEMGFYDIGTSWRALVAGELTIGGKLCVNASGGMKAKGHPIGATGLSASAEMLAQLTGEAGSRQHSGARLGMIQSVGGVSKDSYVFIVAGSGA